MSYQSANDAFWTEASKGVSGTGLRSLLVLLTPVMNAAKDKDARNEFSYELDGRAELKSDAEVPLWLIEQLHERTRRIILSSGMGDSAEPLLVGMKKALGKPGVMKVAAVAAKIGPKAAKEALDVVTGGGVTSARAAVGYVGYAVVGGVVVGAVLAAVATR